MPTKCAVLCCCCASSCRGAIPELLMKQLAIVGSTLLVIALSVRCAAKQQLMMSTSCCKTSYMVCKSSIMWLD